MTALTIENNNTDGGCKGCTKKVRKSLVTAVLNGAYCTLPSMVQSMGE
jgi:hypothetical protein